MTIRVVSSTEAQNQFGKLIEDAQKEPVMVQKNGRDQVVIISASEYIELQKATDNTDEIMKLHEESIDQFGDLYTELAK